MRILVVEDEPGIAAAVRAILMGASHAVDVTSTGPDALDWAATYPYDLIILDVGLPGLDGFAVTKKLRQTGNGCPVLMLTARDALDDRVAGLDAGADDYLAKPFEAAELLARVRALLRRGSSDRPATIRIGDVEIDPGAMRVTKDGSPVRVTAREFALLEVLARNPGQVFAQERLIEAVWDADFEAESNIVEVYIRSLRRKLDGGRRDGLIETVRGAGYRLHDPGPGSS